MLLAFPLLGRLWFAPLTDIAPPSMDAAAHPSKEVGMCAAELKRDDVEC